MRLRYSKADGTQMEFELGDRPITIGRSPEADVVVLDEKASRIHCGIRLWDGDFYIKDLKSKNGTYVNEQRVEVQKLHAGDRVRVGSVIFSFEQEGASDTSGAIQEMEHEMEGGKGYTTLLREIVDNSDDAVEPKQQTTSTQPQPVKIKAKRPNKEE